MLRLLVMSSEVETSLVAYSEAWLLFKYRDFSTTLRSGPNDKVHDKKRSLYTPIVRQNTSPVPGEILNAPASLPPASSPARTLPRHLLYSIFARIGGSGLDTDAFETLRASYRGGFLGKAIAYDNRQKEIPASLIHSLRWHPVRLISFFDRPYYYGAKKNISIGSLRDIWRPDATTCFTVGRAIVCAHFK